MQPTLKNIIEHVSAEYGVTVHEIKSHRRDRKVTFARQVYCWLAKQHTPHSLPTIGRSIGNRDHTTVLHSVRKIGAMVDAGQLATPKLPGEGSSIEHVPAISQETVTRIVMGSRFIVPQLVLYDLPEDKPKVTKPSKASRPKGRVYDPIAFLPRLTGANVTASIMGDPGPHRSALSGYDHGDGRHYDIAAQNERKAVRRSRAKVMEAAE